MRKHVTALAFSLILVSYLASLHIGSIHAVPAIPFRVEQVAWGTSTTNPIEVEPGNTNAPLTVDVRNLSNETLKGVYGTLRLKPTGPFTDYFSGGYNATATGVPLQAGDIFNQTGEILPAGSFSLTFRLNIASSATPGYYTYDVATDYLVKENSTVWLEGQQQTLSITILLPNRPPTIDSFNPSQTALSVNAGNSLNFTSKCSDPDNDPISYEWKLDGILVSTSSGYNYTPNNPDIGSHTMVLTISDGRLSSSQTWTVAVAAVPISHVLLSSNYLTAGLENTLNITIQNNLWKGAVQVRLTVPTPLIMRGNQSWVFESMEPSRNLSTVTSIYAPVGAIGSTSTGTLTINYADERGQAYTDTYNVGLVVQGFINIIVYDLIVSPQPALNGSEVTITATALNTGNIVASFANASIQSSEISDLSRESMSYVGEIEKDSPVPFTLVTRVKPSVQSGTYPITINLAYQDDRYRPHILNITANIIVVNSPESQPQTNEISDIFSFLNAGGWTILIIVAAGIALLILYLRHLSRAKYSSKLTKGEAGVAS